MNNNNNPRYLSQNKGGVSGVKFEESYKNIIIMNVLKVLGGIGLLAGGLALAFFGCKDSRNKGETTPLPEPKRVEEDEIIDDGRDLNPYNRPDCLVPEEAYREAEQYEYSEPTWVRTAKFFADGIPNITRNILNTVSDGYQLYGACHAMGRLGEYRPADGYYGGYSYNREPQRYSGGFQGGYHHRIGNTYVYY